MSGDRAWQLAHRWPLHALYRGRRLARRMRRNPAAMCLSDAIDLRPEFFEPTWKPCYQCDRRVPWLAPDSRCSFCTRLVREDLQ